MLYDDCTVDKHNDHLDITDSLAVIIKLGVSGYTSTYPVRSHVNLPNSNTYYSIIIQLNNNSN